MAILERSGGSGGDAPEGGGNRGSFKTAERMRDLAGAIRDVNGAMREGLQILRSGGGGGEAPEGGGNQGGFRRPNRPVVAFNADPFASRNNLYGQDFARAVNRLAGAVERMDSGLNGLDLRRQGF